MKKLVFLVSICLSLLVTNSFAEQKKGLNVVLTAADAQTQQMAMVLSMMTLKQGKEVNMTLCSKAGDLAVIGMESEVLKPMNKSPKMMLQAIMQKGAKVEICPLYLPNAGKDVSVLIEGITVAKPPKVAEQLLNSDFTTLSY
ncbi:hypothetical protein [Halarcobacter bivalviorum]|uniref:DsrE/DsrF-like family protein n=1 Tax=Halarcobacter bivalviorum TaxID=663364 RepID=A0AAX2A5V6_9BACT|nr:hypothetical protein [Halarcobacter bivalviorum]AXH11347.1 hypothetical protein ABIV_0316 [Halarcobacter bivalviorum]RXK09612.1 hypothetical protein CRV05_09950 [Halarcobacter bivalviorum]